MHHPAHSFTLLQTIQGTKYDSFQLAAQAAGLFNNDSEGIWAMEDTVLNYQSPAELCFLFVLLILEGSPAIPIWDRFSDGMACNFGSNILGPMSNSSKQLALIEIQ